MKASTASASGLSQNTPQNKFEVHLLSLESKITHDLGKIHTSDRESKEVSLLTWSRTVYFNSST